MKLFKRLQEKLLQRDIKNDIAVEKMVKKYPVSLLVEKGVLKRYKDTAFYCADIDSKVLKLAQYYNRDALYTISGELIGQEVCRSIDYLTTGDSGFSKYIIVSDYAMFENTNDMCSYAIYERSGKCVVPHGCYKEIFMTEAYTILSMPERKEGKNVVSRISNEKDENCQEIIGNIVYPQVLIVGENKIVTTKYSTMIPMRDNKIADTKEYPTNTIWVAQQAFVGTKALKIDKKLSIRETFKFPTYHIDRKDFLFDNNSNTVYYINNKNGPTRVNLRNGDEVDLLSLKKIEKTKTTSNKTESGLLHSSMLFADDHTVL